MLSDERVKEIATIVPCFNELAQQLARQLLAAQQDNKRLRTALFNLVKINESWNDAVQATIGRPPGWCDDYLNEARQELGDAT